MTSELPAEVQAIIDAALAWADAPLAYDANELRDIYDAVDAYRKATAPPEPFEVYASYYDGEQLPLITHGTTRAASEVWRCTVTPIERVR